MIAGGGTGGHLFPGVAIAEEARARHPNAEIVFVGTERGIEARVLPELGWPLELIEISGLKTVGLRGALRGMWRIPRALAQSRRLLLRRRPDVVLGVGGYASGPVVLMARLMGISTAILEQNSIPGLANKILGKVAEAVFLAFDETRRFFSAQKILMTGNPIRRDILARLEQPAPASRSGRPRVFVFGGSQGALRLNELVADAAALLHHRGMSLDLLHQTGARSLEETRARYLAAGIAADLRPFIDDMAGEYHRADLVIARAGATTVAELSVVGVPAILVPYPYAADNHQELNARELANAGAARLLRESDLTPQRLADEIAELLTDRSALTHMRAAMQRLGKPGAAQAIVDWCEARANVS